MKTLLQLVQRTIFLVLIIPTICIAQQIPDGPYLGQTPPGLKPEVFAPGIISGKYSFHGFLTFSPDGKEIYWPVIPPQILYVKYENGEWTKPRPASFSNKAQAANFSPDGNRLYYESIQPGGWGSVDIWYVERSGSGWSPPKNIGAPVNSSKLKSQPSFTKDGTIYFSGTLEGAMFNRGIYRSKFTNGKYQRPELLPEQINTKYLDIYPFIALDESYLLFCSTRPSMEEKDRRIYISFRSEDDSWSEPINLNKKINFDVQSAFPYVTPDGKYLFFAGRGIRWMSSKIIEKIEREYK
jgi:Tol biopolymer transport system component